MASVSLCCISYRFKIAIIKLLSQILSYEASFYIYYVRQLSDINAIASFCALNLQIHFDDCFFKTIAFTEKKRN